MTITVLLENSATSADLASEHGLSLWIESDGHTILFDTGASAAFAENARDLGIDLAHADAIVLSHGHYDHAGGLARALDATGAPLYAGSNVSKPKAARSPQGMRDIGFDPTVLRGREDRLRTVEGRCDLFPGVEIVPAAPLKHDPPSDNRRLLREADDGYERDPFEDELSLLLQTPAGAVLVTGCSHRGIANIYDAADVDVHAVVGGLHLSHESDEEVRAVAHLLHGARELDVGHCTGDAAAQVLARELPGRVHGIPAGTVLTF